MFVDLGPTWAEGSGSHKGPDFPAGRGSGGGTWRAAAHGARWDPSAPFPAPSPCSASLSPCSGCPGLWFSGARVSLSPGPVPTGDAFLLSSAPAGGRSWLVVPARRHGCSNSEGKVKAWAASGLPCKGNIWGKSISQTPLCIAQVLPAHLNWGSPVALLSPGAP